MRVLGNSGPCEVEIEPWGSWPGPVPPSPASGLRDSSQERVSKPSSLGAGRWREAWIGQGRPHTLEDRLAVTPAFRRPCLPFSCVTRAKSFVSIASRGRPAHRSGWGKCYVRHDGLHLAPHGLELPAGSGYGRPGPSPGSPGSAALATLLLRLSLGATSCGVLVDTRGDSKGAALVGHGRLVDARLLQVEALEHGHEERVQGRGGSSHLRGCRWRGRPAPGRGDRGPPSRAASFAFSVALPACSPASGHRAPERPRAAPAPAFSRRWAPVSVSEPLWRPERQRPPEFPLFAPEAGSQDRRASAVSPPPSDPPSSNSGVQCQAAGGRLGEVCGPFTARLWMPQRAFGGSRKNAPLAESWPLAGTCRS